MNFYIPTDDPKLINSMNFSTYHIAYIDRHAQTAGTKGYSKSWKLRKNWKHK
jgi:hypothetical protein